MHSKALENRGIHDKQALTLFPLSHLTGVAKLFDQSGLSPMLCRKKYTSDLSNYFSIKLFVLAIAFFMAVLLSAQAHAATKTWTCASSLLNDFWSDPLNWSPAGVPAPTDTITIPMLSTGCNPRETTRLITVSGVLNIYSQLNAASGLTITNTGVVNIFNDTTGNWMPGGVAVGGTTTDAQGNVVNMPLVNNGIINFLPGPGTVANTLSINAKFINNGTINATTNANLLPIWIPGTRLSGVIDLQQGTLNVAAGAELIVSNAVVGAGTVVTGSGGAVRAGGSL